MKNQQILLTETTVKTFKEFYQLLNKLELDYLFQKDNEKLPFDTLEDTEKVTDEYFKEFYTNMRYTLDRFLAVYGYKYSDSPFTDEQIKNCIEYNNNRITKEKR